MKTVNNKFKSKVFKAAWTNFKKSAKSFSDCLKSAWAWAKKTLSQSEYTLVPNCNEVKETAKAILVDLGGYNEWIPKSVLGDMNVSVGDGNFMQVKTWFVNKNLK
jgi:hypothetical protein